MNPESSDIVAPPVAEPTIFPAAPLPRDVWPLVWGHLPVQGLLAASHTCRGWRADMLEISRLWTQLDLHAYDAHDREHAVVPRTQASLHGKTLSNMGVLEHLLPRSKSQLLTLDVEVAVVVTDEQFQLDLFEFLDILGPRLTVLRMVTADPIFPGEILCDRGWSWPELRILTLSPCASCTRKNRVWEAGFIGEDMPNLRHLSLHENFRLESYDSKWANLESLQCTVNTILDIESILLSATGLQQLRCECLLNPVASPRSGELMWPNAPLLAALSRIPDVHIATVLGPSSVNWVFNFFVIPPRPRLRVEFCVERDSLPFLRACSQLASATHLTMRSSGGSDTLTIEPEDGSGRFFQFVLSGLRPGGLGPLLDWELVPPLNELTSLRVDASLWPAVMQRFPHARLLANVTLVMRHTDDARALLSAGRVTHFPIGATLTLTSEPIAIPRRQVVDLAAALGVGRLSMTGNVYEK